MSRSSSAKQAHIGPIKTSIADDSNCSTSYEYNDPSADSARCTTVTHYPSRMYVIESKYTLEVLAKWDSKHARLHRKMYPNGRYALPQNPEPYKPVDIMDVETPRLAGDDKNNIRALQPGVRIIPVKDVIVIQRFGRPPELAAKYKAIIPRKHAVARSKQFEGKLRENFEMIMAQIGS